MTNEDRAKGSVKQYHIDKGLVYDDSHWVGMYKGNDTIYAVMKKNRIISVFKIDKDYQYCGGVMNVEELNKKSLRPKIKEKI